MRPRDRALALMLDDALRTFHQQQRHLPGIQAAKRRQAFLEQLLESAHRVEYVSIARAREQSAQRADPNDVLFDPLLAAMVHQRRGSLDEAFWLVFLFVHFGRHPKAGWRYAREVYGRLGSGALWDWPGVSSDPSAFRDWLDGHQSELKREGVARGFGNHRKYQSLSARSAVGTGAAVESYVRWVNPPHTHQELIANAVREASGDPRQAFQVLFQSMEAVRSFGRTARFDYLTMIGKLALAPIEPGSAYLQGSSGPLSGARLLFGVGRTPAELDTCLVELGAQLHVGMQVLEDALCNWQKSPQTFKPFRL